MNNDLPSIRVRTKPRVAADMGGSALPPQERLLIQYMVHGLAHEDLCQRLMVKRREVVGGFSCTVERHPVLFEPLSVDEAATVLRMRLRRARSLAGSVIFKRELAAEVERYREGQRAASVRRLVEMRDDPGLGKAADRKVQMQAAMVLLGEIGGSSTTVNVSVGNTTITAGIVIDMRDDDEVDPPTIEHEAKR